MAAALRLQGGALLGAADAFGELTSVPAAPPAAPSPADTPTGLAAGAGAAGFGGAGPPRGGASEASNPYHSTGSLSSGGPGAPPPGDGHGYHSAGQAGAMANSTMGVGGSSKRFSEPEAAPATALGPTGKSSDGGAPTARFPVPEQPSDNPYAVRAGTYTYS